MPQGVPWFPDDVEAWSVRWVLLHLIEETARHAGHADIVRETIDGATVLPADGRRRRLARNRLAPAVDTGGTRRRVTRYFDRISAAARSPERTAPSIAPCDVVDVSVPAQCTRPNGSRSSGP